MKKMHTKRYPNWERWHPAGILLVNLKKPARYQRSQLKEIE